MSSKQADYKRLRGDLLPAEGVAVVVSVLGSPVMLLRVRLVALSLLGESAVSSSEPPRCPGAVERSTLLGRASSALCTDSSTLLSAIPIGKTSGTPVSPSVTASSCPSALQGANLHYLSINLPWSLYLQQISGVLAHSPTRLTIYWYSILGFFLLFSLMSYTRGAMLAESWIPA